MHKRNFYKKPFKFKLDFSRFHIKNHFVRNMVFILCGLGMLVFAGVFIWLASIRIPDFKAFNERQIITSTKLYDRTGTVLLYDLNNDIRRTIIPLSEMSKNVQNATVAVEDAQFWDHSGVRIRSFLRAILVNLANGKLSQGGSTLTQQIVKNTLLTQEKTITRKLKEWVLAIKVEQAYGKEKILEMYLNEAPYGGTIYGVEEASLIYFGKKASDLTLAEAAYLAAIPRSPTGYSPYRHKDALDARKNFVLDRMFETGFITSTEQIAAKQEVVVFKTQDTRRASIKAPHFVFFVKDYLIKKYGEKMVEEGGLKVTTTLNYDWQQKSETIVNKNVLINEKTYNASNGSMITLDPKTGQILTMVGSRDYFDKAIDGEYNVTTAKRQPGSSFKPFVYALGFKKGFTPESILFNLRTEFNPSCGPYGAGSGCYRPQNYGGLYDGPVTIREAIGRSLNVPAVKMLYMVGIKDTVEFAKDLGFTTFNDPDRVGLTLVLGGNEVTMVEMAQGYGVFANGGEKKQYTPILKVEDPTGKVLEEYKNEEGQQVLDRNIALTVSDILTDDNARRKTFGLNSTLNIKERPVAVKTGTTNNFKDAWIFGYTPGIVVGAWVGNNDNTPMKDTAMSGMSVAPMWNEYIRAILPSTPYESFEKPLQPDDYLTRKPVLRGKWWGGESYFMDKISGKRATAFTPNETKTEIVVPEVHDTLYWINRANILGPRLNNPYNDPQMRNWETVVQNWWASAQSWEPVPSASTPPETYDDVHTEAAQPKITLSLSPADAVTSTTDVLAKATISAQNPIKKVEFYINGALNETLQSQPFEYTFKPKDVANITSGGQLEVRVIATDTLYNKGETIKTLTVN